MIEEEDIVLSQGIYQVYEHSLDKYNEDAKVYMIERNNKPQCYIK